MTLQWAVLDLSAAIQSPEEESGGANRYVEVEASNGQSTVARLLLNDHLAGTKPLDPAPKGRRGGHGA